MIVQVIAQSQSLRCELNQNRLLCGHDWSQSEYQGWAKSLRPCVGIVACASADRIEGQTEVVRKEEQDHLRRGSELQVDDILIGKILNDLFSYLCDYIM